VLTSVRTVGASVIVGAGVGVIVAVGAGVGNAVGAGVTVGAGVGTEVTVGTGVIQSSNGRPSTSPLVIETKTGPNGAPPVIVPNSHETSLLYASFDTVSE